jgi:hypothetical protein
MHEEVYGQNSGTGPSPAARDRDANGNPKQSEHLPGLHLDNSMVEGAAMGLNIGMAAALITGNSGFAPEAALAGAGLGAYLAHNK